MNGSDRRRRPQRRAPDAKQARILEVATRLFATNGYDGTPTSRIAREAQVSEGIVFHHFSNKAGVLAAVAREFGEQLNAVMFADVTLDEPPDVDAMIGRCFDHVEVHGAMHQLLNEVSDPAVVGAAMDASRQAIVDALTEHFEAWHARGFIGTDVPEIAASLMFGLVEYAMHACFKTAPPGERVSRARRDAYLAETVRVIRAALRADDARR